MSKAESELVAELADEFAERFRHGERPPISEFVRRCPEAEEEIREVFSAIAHVERLAPAPHDERPTPNLAADVLHMPTALGDFRIVREVGRGGMGIVYEAEQVSLGRQRGPQSAPATFVDRRPAARSSSSARPRPPLGCTTPTSCRCSASANRRDCTIT